MEGLVQHLTQAGGGGCAPGRWQSNKAGHTVPLLSLRSSECCSLTCDNHAHWSLSTFSSKGTSFLRGREQT